MYHSVTQKCLSNHYYQFVAYLLLVLEPQFRGGNYPDAVDHHHGHAVALVVAIVLLLGQHCRPNHY